MTDKARLHKVISYWKSGLRLVGYVLIPINLVAAAVVLFVSELLGYAEEIWGA